MKKTLIVAFAALSLIGCQKQIAESVYFEQECEGISFLAGFDADSKVATEAGVNSWEAGDSISVFSAASGAAAGVSVGTNVVYKSAGAGTSVALKPSASSIAPSDKYYAFYPASAKYPAKLNAASGIGFDGVAASAVVSDYRFLPVTVNSGATFVVDPATGLGVTTNSSNYFYAAADAQGSGNTTISLNFKPLLPVLEFDLYGEGTVKTMVVAYTDKAKDPFSNDNWLSAKGVADISTGAVTVTNYSSTAYHKLTVTLKESDEVPYITLSKTIPARIKLHVGRFNVTKGLTLTFTDKDGNTFTKAIWADKTVCSQTDDGKCKHIRQGINVPYVSASTASAAFTVNGGTYGMTVNSSSSWSVKSKPEWITLTPDSGSASSDVVITAAQNESGARNGNIVLKSAEGAVCSIAVSQEAYVPNAADFFSVDISSIDWTVSSVHDVKDAASNVIARITKEYFGKTVNKQGIVVYPAPSGKPDYSAGLVAELTLDGGSAVSGNVHCGTVNANTADPAGVIYSAGTSAAVGIVYVKADGTEVYASNPATGSQSVSAGSPDPVVLVSNVKSHGTVKVGNLVWLAEDYKSTKFADGTDISVYAASDAYWNANDKTVTVYEKDGITHYMYTGNAIGYDGTSFTGGSAFAPAGWRLCTRDEYKTSLLGFVGTYANLTGQSLFGATSNMKATKSSNKVAVGALNYTNTWTSTPNAAKGYMCGMKPDGSTVDSAQAATASFSVRLVME